MSQAKPVVGVVMGSSSDWDVMQHAVLMLTEFGVPHEAQVISAHRMPDQMFDYAKSARTRGLRAIIAGAGGVQMPKGIPVATFAIGEAGAANAALAVIAMLAADDAALADKLLSFRARQTEAAQAMTLPA